MDVGSFPGCPQSQYPWSVGCYCTVFIALTICLAVWMCPSSVAVQQCPGQPASLGSPRKICYVWKCAAKPFLHRESQASIKHLSYHNTAAYGAYGGITACILYMHGCKMPREAAAFLLPASLERLEMLRTAPAVVYRVCVCYVFYAGSLLLAHWNADVEMRPVALRFSFLWFITPCSTRNVPSGTLACLRFLSLSSQLPRLHHTDSLLLYKQLLNRNPSKSVCQLSTGCWVYPPPFLRLLPHGQGESSQPSYIGASCPWQPPCCSPSGTLWEKSLRERLRHF